MAQCAYKTTMFALLFSQNLALFLLNTHRLADLFIFFHLAIMLNQGWQCFSPANNTTDIFSRQMKTSYVPAV
jgi:hypothetical protein